MGRLAFETAAPALGLMPVIISATVSLTFGLAMGVAVHRLLQLRCPSAPARPWLHATVLGAASLGLALLPALRDPIALSQALLLLYLLYPLALVDLVTLTIEPALVLVGMALRLLAVAVTTPAQAPEMLGGLLAGAGLLTVVAFGYEWLRGREGLGEGDPLVLGLIGAFVGWGGLLPVVLASSAAGLLVGLPALVLLRKPLHTPLPFAPFLCLGGLLVYIGQAHGLRFFGLLPPLG